MPLQIFTVKEIEKERNRRYDTSDRHTSLFYSAIDLYADTYYDSVYRITYCYCCFCYLWY